MSSIDRDRLSALFTAADRLCALSPWDTAYDSQLVHVLAPQFGWSTDTVAAFVSVEGDERGLLVFRSVNDYLDFVEQGRAADGEEALEVPLLSINFDNRKLAPRAEVQQARALDVRPANGRDFVWLERTGADGHAIAIEPADYAFASALMSALATLLEAHRDLFERPSLDAAAPLSAAASTDGGEVAVEVPHPDAPWEWDQTPFSYFAWLEAEERIDAFHDATGHSSEARDVALAELFAYKIDTRGEEPLELTPEDVEEFLLDYFPGEVHVPEAEAVAVPERIGAFFSWLGQMDEIERDVAEALRGAAERHRDEFLRRIADPALFGPAKRIVVAAEAASVDLDDPDAAARFIDAFQAQAEARAPKAWVWNPADPPPEPNAPCPCGSGKRYRKCCRPR